MAHVTGGNGNQLAAGNAGADRLHGDAGSDVVLGGDGADYLTGDANDGLLFDGGFTVSSPSGNDASTLYNDSSHQATPALLNDWNDNLHIDLAITSNHNTVVDDWSTMRRMVIASLRALPEMEFQVDVGLRNFNG